MIKPSTIQTGSVKVQTKKLTDWFALSKAMLSIQRNMLELMVSIYMQKFGRVRHPHTHKLVTKEEAAKAIRG